MSITRLSVQALRVLEESSLVQVHSVYTKVVYLRVDDRLVSCTSDAISAPLGIEMASDDVAELKAHAHTPAMLLGWDRNQRLLADRTGVPVIGSTPTTAVFDAALPVSAGADLGDFVVDRLVAHLGRIHAATGLGDDWPALLDDPHVVEAVTSLRAGRVDPAVAYWLGRGRGLTPSGDDLLVGMIAALRFTGVIDDDAADRIARPLIDAATGSTTEVSVEYLHGACQGIALGALRDVLVAIDRLDKPGAADAVGRLRLFGHTSGMDTLLGALAALRQLTTRP